LVEEAIVALCSGAVECDGTLSLWGGLSVVGGGASLECCCVIVVVVVVVQSPACWCGLGGGLEGLERGACECEGTFS
jgi:hypothetical protein